MTGTRFDLEVQPVIPQALARLEELSTDLKYSWNRSIRTLYAHLDRELWDLCGHNPKLFLRRVAQDKLDTAARNLVYQRDYHAVLSDYDTYLAKEVNPEVKRLVDPEHHLVAYFCAEFGMHESLPIYSGGLGILAGDYCKAASDLSLPFIGVGLLYRVGYFEQTLDGSGQQQLRLGRLEFNDLPTSPLLDAEQRPLTVQLELPGRVVQARLWQVRVGHIRILLLDTDTSANSPEDRLITYQLYGGDKETRIQQEIVLGVGGTRALRALGMKPTVWHINEGHAAFLVIERCRELVEQGLDFGAALEQVASGTVFTTHTPVPAGHDIFEPQDVLHYLGHYVKRLGITEEVFLKLGDSPNHGRRFNQTALALRGSRFHNGVSRTHAEVASKMEAYVWPEIPPEENPIGCVANAVHVRTFLAAPWVHLFDLRFGVQWRNELLNEFYWSRIDDLPNSAFWSARQLLKSDLINEVRERANKQFKRNGYSESLVKRLTRNISPENDCLIIGFGRRFAAYKRATLLFRYPERLARLLNDPDRPVLVLFAGKAHPHDGPGQELIRAVHDFSRQPPFEGKVLLVEGYDLALARRLIPGVDVWLNTPRHPLEASGTSGMKAGINGVLHLSILDGWWPEAYDGSFGWAITPQADPGGSEPAEDAEARELLDILEHEAIPLYYQRNRQGFPEGWIEKSKASMKSLLPRYGAERMVMDYVRQAYSPVAQQQGRLAADNFAGARELGRWKRRVAECWPHVSLQLRAKPSAALKFGEPLTLIIGVQLAGLDPEDIVAEALFGLEREGAFQVGETRRFSAHETNASGETLFNLRFIPDISGLQSYKVRIYPFHSLLTHRFETGLMKWI